MKKGLVSIGLFLLAAFVMSCGYHGQVSIPDDLKRIHLAISSTGVSRPGLQTHFTQALTQRILSGGGQVVKGRNQADATMKATITALERNPVAFDSRDLARRFRLVVVIDLEVIQQKGKVELAREQVRGEAYYSAPRGITGTQVAEDEAIGRALRDLADRVVTRMLESF
ncbi:MAG: LPS assembly lipoprotein LptE [candidate division NC10 bacterium]|nr:hypothetical protein [candidate division NC10 bacterium]MCH7895282.1 hypothetical protein [candidate division NC10 bacterium]MCZ6550197.1 LPS assembly lipoprotein LptE [candidate division NC10 bacterium]